MGGHEMKPLFNTIELCLLFWPLLFSNMRLLSALARDMHALYIDIAGVLGAIIYAVYREMFWLRSVECRAFHFLYPLPAYIKQSL